MPHCRPGGGGAVPLALIFLIAGSQVSRFMPKPKDSLSTSKSYLYKYVLNELVTSVVC